MPRLTSRQTHLIDAAKLLDNGDEHLPHVLAAVLALKVVKGDELRFEDLLARWCCMDVVGCYCQIAL